MCTSFGRSRITGAAIVAGLIASIGCGDPTTDPNAATSSTLSAAPIKGGGPTGNLLIADQFNNRVIEIAADGRILWHFGIGPNDLSAASILGVNDAERIGSHTLMAGTGVPPGAGRGCPSGCADNRVILVDKAGRSPEHQSWRWSGHCKGHQNQWCPHRKSRPTG